MKKIPLTQPYFSNSEISNLRRCLKSGWVTQGPLVAEFERRFAVLHDVPYALAVNSCTTALHLSALAIGLGPNDEAIVPAFTWVASANCIEHAGAKAVFADIDSATFNLDPASLERAITPRTKAVVAVHLFGLSADMGPIMAIAKKYRLKVIEDAACAVRSRYDGKPVGGIGDVGCFSFHPRKIITTGEGGMLTTNSGHIVRIVDSLRSHGTVGPQPGPGAMSRPYDMSVVANLGYNFRLSDIQGAVGLAQMEKLNKLLESRAYWANRYTVEISRIPELIAPFVPQRCHHTYQAYVVRLKKGGKRRRNALMDYLAQKGIWTRPGTHAVHRLKFYAQRYRLRPGDFPNAARAEDETIALPLYHGLREKEFGCVIRALKAALSHT